MRVLIVGAGFGGIAAAIELRRHGIREVTILEKASDLGGTWFYNSYPGAACDVPSHLYSFSFAQRRDWSRLCSPQQEIHEYLHTVAREHGIEQLVRTRQTVTACAWSEESCTWTVETAAGETHEAEALILATGQLHQQHRPRIEGADTFAGHSFHSAEWDHDYPLAGKRVGVIGTGASAVQFVPEIAPAVERMTIFQRTGNWFLPRRNRPYPAALKAAFELVPGLQEFRRKFVFEYGESLTAMIRHPRTLGLLGRARSTAFMRMQLKDPQLRRKIWPGYTFGCKRVLFSSSFLPALQRANVDVVTDPISAISPEGILDSSGRTHELDCIIWATGFKTNDFMFPMAIAGREGRELSEEWSGGAHAHLGICVPGLPEHVRPVRPQHEHIGRLDHLLPRDPGRLCAPGPPACCGPRRRGRSRYARMSRPPATGRFSTASPAPPGQSATPGIATSRGESSPTGPATCASISPRPRSLMSANTALRRCPSARRSCEQQRGVARCMTM